MTYPITFEHEGVVLGVGEIDSEFNRGELVVPCGKLWVCPKCARVWAKASIPDRYYEIWAKSCGCQPSPYYFEFAGSMVLEWDHRLWDAMPHAMLLREVIHHCNLWDWFNGQGTV